MSSIDSSPEGATQSDRRSHRGKKLTVPPPSPTRDSLKRERDQLLSMYRRIWQGVDHSRTLERIGVRHAIASSSAEAADQLTLRVNPTLAVPLRQFADAAKQQDRLDKARWPTLITLGAHLGFAKFFLPAVLLPIVLPLWNSTDPDVQLVTLVGILIGLVAVAVVGFRGLSFARAVAHVEGRIVRDLHPAQETFFNAIGGSEPSIRGLAITKHAVRWVSLGVVLAANVLFLFMLLVVWITQTINYGY